MCKPFLQPLSPPVADLLAVAMLSLPAVRALLPDFLSTRGRASTSPQTLGINPETAGIPAAHGRGRAQKGCAARREGRLPCPLQRGCLCVLGRDRLSCAAAATGSWLARSAEGPKHSFTRLVKSVTFTEV